MALRTNVFVMSLTVLVSMPAVARAATVYTAGTGDQRSIVYTAARGEGNRLAVQDVEANPFEARLVETSAPLSVFPSCIAPLRGGPVALCPIGLSGVARIDLGDRADVAVITGQAASAINVRAGAGDDQVVADSAPASVSGGPGNDRIRLGNNLIIGNARGDDGSDIILGGPYGITLSGGPGDDLVLNQGQIGFAEVEGNAGNDVLRLHYTAPSGDANGASGGPGDDVLFVSPPEGPIEPWPRDEPFITSWYLAADAGRDLLIGGVTPDTFDAGADDDVVVASDGNAESVFCGTGFDVVYADRQDTLHDCEIQLTMPLARAGALRQALERLSNPRGAASGALATRARTAFRGAIRAEG